MTKVKKVIKNTFISLRHRDFRYFWLTQCISLMGTFMQRTAQAWLIYTITKSPFKLGVLGVCQFAPNLLFSLFAGVIVDRFPKRKIIITTQCLFMVQAAILTYFTFSKRANFYNILLVAAFYGIVQTFDMPARQSYFIEIVGKEDIMNAVSLNSTIVNLARIVGPAVAGAIMVAFGPFICFLCNTLSFIPVITGLLFIKTPDRVVERKSNKMFKEIRAGISYVNKSYKLKIAFIMMAVVCTFAMNNDVISAVFAKTVLSGGPKEYSMLLSSMGIGSFIGAILMAGRSRGASKINMLFVNGIIVSIILMVAFFSKNLYITLVLTGVIGFLNLIFLNMANSTLQLNSTDEYRGRVMSIYGLLNMGTTPIGNVYAGIVMEHLGAAAGFFMCGLATLILSLGALFYSKNRKFKK